MRSNSHKRGIITEELCAITDGPWEAVLLRQLIYWLTRCDTIDAYLEEVGAEEKGVPKTGGWVYKSARAIGEEIMMQSSPRTVRKRLKALVEKGYADEREDPERKMDRRKQYRVNVVKVEGALREHGYSLQSVMGKDWGVVSERVAAFYESNAPSADSTNGQTKTKRHARDKRNTETTPENTAESPARESGADESNPSPTRAGQTDKGKGSAPKSNAEKEGEHWALVTFRRQMEHYKDGLDYCDVQAFAQDKITSTVTDRALWRKAIEKGLTRGWQHTSVDAFLDHYKREEEHKAIDGGDGSASANAFVRGEDGLSPYERRRQQALERQAKRSGEKVSSGAGRL